MERNLEQIINDYAAGRIKKADFKNVMLSVINDVAQNTYKGVTENVRVNFILDTYRSLLVSMTKRGAMPQPEDIPEKHLIEDEDGDIVISGGEARWANLLDGILGRKRYSVDYDGWLYDHCLTKAVDSWIHFDKRRAAEAEELKRITSESKEGEADSKTV